MVCVWSRGIRMVQGFSDAVSRFGHELVVAGRCGKTVTPKMNDPDEFSIVKADVLAGTAQTGYNSPPSSSVWPPAFVSITDATFSVLTPSIQSAAPLFLSCGLQLVSISRCRAYTFCGWFRSKAVPKTSSRTSCPLPEYCGMKRNQLRGHAAPSPTMERRAQT